MARYIFDQWFESSRCVVSESREWTIPGRGFEVGLASREQHGGVASADLDNDGDPDLVIVKDCTLGTLQEMELLRDGGVEVAWNNDGVLHQSLTFKEKRLN